jgi:uncharacterized protein (TIGR02246 family)
MRTAAIVGFTLVSSLAFGAKPQAGRQAAGSDAGIKQIADSYVKATLAGDPKAVAALYTEDAVEMPPNTPPIKGRAAIEAYYTKMMSGGGKVNSFSIDHTESHASGDTGYDVGTYKQSMTPPGATAPLSETGKYVVLLKKTAGAWKVAYAIYNSDAPPPTGR